jgi:hypothetical protein
MTTGSSLPTTGVEAATFLMSKGLSKDAAVAITACLWYESKLNPGSQGVQPTEKGGILNPSGAYGIASWNGPRQAALSTFALKKNFQPGELHTQLWFVLNEAANSYPKTWAAISGSAGYAEIIPVFVADYENPADHVKEIAAAMGFAKELYLLVTVAHAVTEAPAPPTGSSPVAEAPPAPTGPAAPPIPGSSPGTRPMIYDEEFAVMEEVFQILSALPQSALHRVLIYLYSRLNP